MKYGAATTSLRTGSMLALSKRLPTWWQRIPVLGIITVIFAAALTLRLYDIQATPPSLYWEEVALGYDAYSILKTGKDHHGNPFPVVAFPSFGDYKPSLYFYALVPSVATFGLTPLAVRLPAALASSLTVALAAWLAWRWTGSRALLAWTGVILAVQPWSWLIGRAGFEVNLAVFLIVAAVACFQLDDLIKKPVLRHLLRMTGAVLCALAAYAYHAGRVWGPLVGLLMWITAVGLPTTGTYQSWAKKTVGWLLPALVAGALLLPILAEVQSPAVQQRLQETSRFSDTAPIVLSVEHQESVGNTWWSRYVFHRAWWRGADLLQAYSSHFQPDFLFGRGDTNPRHATHYFGMLAPWEALSVMIGAYVLIFAWPGSGRNRQKLTGLLIISPLAAMFTLATPHALRALLLSPWLAILSALGILAIAEKLTTVWRALKLRLPAAQLLSHAVLGVIVLSFASLFWAHLRYIYPHQTQGEWQYGYQEMVETVLNHQQDDERIFISRGFGRPAMYVFFFAKIDPARVQAANVTAKMDQQELLEFENWTFFSGNPPDAGLFAYPADVELPSDLEILSTIYDLDQEPVWNVARRH